MALVCPKWGDGSLWGDGDLWCGLTGTVQYIAYPGSRERTALTTWNLQSPNTRTWTPSITVAGILSFTDGTDTLTTVPVAPAPNGDVWTPTITDGGVITLTSSADAGENQASLIDADSVQWWWSVPESTVSTWATHNIVGAQQKLHRVSLQVLYDDGGIFVIDSIRLCTMIAAQAANRFVAYTDFTSHKRLSVQVVYTAADAFVIDRIHIIANVKKHQPRG